MPPNEQLDQNKPALTLITGWAHGREAMQPVADALCADYDIEILTGAEVLAQGALPEADYIFTGSMGGLLALEHLPGCCKKLVLISSTAKFCSDEDYTCGTPDKVLRRMILQLKRKPQDVLTEFFKNVHHPQKQEGADSVVPVAADELEELAAGLEYLLHTDLRERIAGLQIPVLLLHGSEDRIIPPAASEWLHDQLPDSRLKIYDQQGHALLAHHFETVMDEIVRFLA